MSRQQEKDADLSSVVALICPMAATLYLCEIEHMVPS